MSAAASPARQSSFCALPAGPRWLPRRPAFGPRSMEAVYQPEDRTVRIVLKVEALAELTGQPTSCCVDWQETLREGKWRRERNRDRTFSHAGVVLLCSRMHVRCRSPASWILAGRISAAKCGPQGCHLNGENRQNRGLRGRADTIIRRAHRAADFAPGGALCVRSAHRSPSWGEAMCPDPQDT